jgi:MtN3 and saliva related transmembrane protein
MEPSDLLGYLAALLTTVAFVPQAWKTFRTRDVSGISLGMYSVFTAGVAAWLVYGVLRGDWPIILANAVTLALACAVLVMKLRFRKRG